MRFHSHSTSGGPKDFVLDLVANRREDVGHLRRRVAPLSLELSKKQRVAEKLFQREQGLFT